MLLSRIELQQRSTLRSLKAEKLKAALHHLPCGNIRRNPKQLYFPSATAQRFCAPELVHEDSEDSAILRRYLLRPGCLQQHIHAEYGRAKTGKPTLDALKGRQDSVGEWEPGVLKPPEICSFCHEHLDRISLSQNLSRACLQCSASGPG